jgi:oligoendopeptidase F
VDMAVWHWMYENPEATPAELREATLTIARDVWNTWWAPVLGPRDSVLLGVYSHMVARTLYLPDYPIGSLIAVQLEEQMAESGDLGGEFARVCAIGRVVPDLWMTEATGSPVSPGALLAAAEAALQLLHP